jgi:hypothetical protein
MTDIMEVEQKKIPAYIYKRSLIFFLWGEGGWLANSKRIYVSISIFIGCKKKQEHTYLIIAAIIAAKLGNKK